MKERRSNAMVMGQNTHWYETHARKKGKERIKPPTPNNRRNLNKNNLRPTLSESRAYMLSRLKPRTEDPLKSLGNKLQMPRRGKEKGKKKGGVRMESGQFSASPSVRTGAFWVRVSQRKKKKEAKNLSRKSKPMDEPSHSRCHYFLTEQQWRNMKDRNPSMKQGDSYHSKVDYFLTTSSVWFLLHQWSFFYWVKKKKKNTSHPFTVTSRNIWETSPSPSDVFLLKFTRPHKVPQNDVTGITMSGLWVFNHNVRKVLIWALQKHAEHENALRCEDFLSDTCDFLPSENQAPISAQRCDMNVHAVC